MSNQAPDLDRITLKDSIWSMTAPSYPSERFIATRPEQKHYTVSGAPSRFVKRAGSSVWTKAQT